MKQHSTKVFRDIVNALGSFIQSLFIVPNAGNAAAVSAPAGQSLSFLSVSMKSWKARPYFIKKATIYFKYCPRSAFLIFTYLITLWLSVQVAQVQAPRVRHKVAQVREGSAEICPHRLLLNSVVPGFLSWLLASRAALRPHSKCCCPLNTIVKWVLSNRFAYSFLVKQHIARKTLREYMMRKIKVCFYY